MATRVRTLEKKILWFTGNARPHHGWGQGKIFDFGGSRSLGNVFLRVWFAAIHQCRYSWYEVILLKFERTDLLSFAVLQNQIIVTDRLKTWRYNCKV